MYTLRQFCDVLVDLTLFEFCCIGKRNGFDVPYASLQRAHLHLQIAVYDHIYGIMIELSHVWSLLGFFEFFIVCRALRIITDGAAAV